MKIVFGPDGFPVAVNSTELRLALEQHMRETPRLLEPAYAARSHARLYADLAADLETNPRPVGSFAPELVAQVLRLLSSQAARESR